MKNLTLIICILFSLVTKAQDDTLLVSLFDSVATDAQENVVVGVTNELDLAGWGNLDWLGSDLEPDLVDPTSQWYDAQLWKTWHKIPYIESIDTIIGVDTVTYDTTVNVGMRSFSWFEDADQASSVLLSPPVWLSDNTSKLTWKSMPIQGPRYQDGYEVIILTGKNHTIWTAYPEGLTAQFTMKEMDNSTVTPHEIDSSLAKIENENGFIPLAGTNHTQYSLPEPTGSGLVDSSRQHPFMQAFELDLSSYSGFIQVMFHHNSHDDNGIIIDDVVLTGTGVVGTKEVNNISLVAYPNPAVSEITIDLKEVNNYDNIRVYSMQGQLVKELKGVFAANGQVSIDVANLPTGVYQIEVINDSNKYYGKFSKK